MTALSSIILRDTHANRPAFGTAGRLYYETDTTTLFRDSGTAWESVEGAGGGGSGTVTSVDLTVPGILSVSGSPVTTSGTLAVTLATETANQIFAGPASGGAATPAFRALVAADVPYPALTTLTTTLGADVTMGSTSTWTDVLSLSLTTGTWLVNGSALCVDTSALVQFNARLWDGTTQFILANGSVEQTNQGVQLPLTWPVVAAGSVTLKLQVEVNSTGGSVAHLSPNMSGGGPATYLSAVRIA